MDSRFTRPAEDFAKSAAEYIDLKVDEVKLRTAKGLSITLNQILLATLFLSLGSIVLMAAAFGSVLSLGDLVGRYAAGAFFVAGVFLPFMGILFLLRKLLILNRFVLMFITLFFSDEGGVR